MQQEAYMPNYMQEQIEITKAIVIEVPGEQAIEHKPLEVVFSDRILHDLNNATQGGEDLCAAAFTNIAHKIVRPSRQSHGEVFIPNGWRESKNVVMIEFTIRAMDSIRREWVTFYSSRNGATASGFVAPELQLTPNSRISTVEQIGHGAHGTTRSYQLRENSQILQPVTINMASSVQTGQFGMRPQDIFKTIQSNNWSNNNQQYGMNPHAPKAIVIDPRARIKSKSGCLDFSSSRTSNISSRYLSTVAGSYRQARTEASECKIPLDERNVLGIAIRYAKEQMASASVLFNHLLANSDMGETGNITWGELAYLFPILNDPNFIKVNVIPRHETHDVSEDFMSWNSTSSETHIQTLMSHIVPAIAQECLFASLSFTCTNETLSGEIEITTPVSVPLFNDNKDISRLQRFEHVFKQQVVPEVFFGLCESFTVFVEYNVLGSTEIIVSLDGQKPERRRLPNYCDNLSTMVIAANEQQLHNNSNSIGMMLKGLIDPTFA